MEQQLQVTFLGTGTSQGIPIIGSKHPVCLSSNPKDKRLRVSVLRIEATEDQVCRHLESHLERLPPEDARSREIIEHMHADEAEHGAAALERGGSPFPAPVRQAMTLLSRVMTETTYRF